MPPRAPALSTANARLPSSPSSRTLLDGGQTDRMDGHIGSALKCEGGGDVVGVVTLLVGGVAQAFHGDQVVAPTLWAVEQADPSVKSAGAELSGILSSDVVTR